jgi:LDH2 family malate/lactate/ureidoglycolate dehydrogenase
MDIAHFQPLVEFTARMDRMVDYVKSSRVKPGATGVFVPGELAARRKRDYRQHGIPLDRPIRESLARHAAAAGLSYEIELAG